MTTVSKLVFVLQSNYLVPRFVNVWANYGPGTICGPRSVSKFRNDLSMRSPKIATFQVFFQCFQIYFNKEQTTVELQRDKYMFCVLLASHQITSSICCCSGTHPSKSLLTPWPVNQAKQCCSNVRIYQKYDQSHSMICNGIWNYASSSIGE